MSTPFNKIPEEALGLIYNGCHQDIVKDLKHAGISKKIKINFEGLIPFLEQVVEDKENYEATLIERHFTTDEVLLRTAMEQDYSLPAYSLKSTVKIFQRLVLFSF